MIDWVEKVNEKDSPLDKWNGIHFPNIGAGVVELRRTFKTDLHYSQILIRIRPDNVVEMSMNGKASMTVPDVIEITQVVIEGQIKLALAVVGEQ